MTIDRRLRGLEKLGLRARKELPVTIEKTADGKHYILTGADRVLIGDEAAFEKWQALGNRCGVLLAGLTTQGSELVRRIVSGERTTSKGDK